MSVKIDVDPDDAVANSQPARWAVSHLQETLARDADRADVSDWTVLISGAKDDQAAKPESFAITRDGNTITVKASDARGLVYALTELADRATRTGAPKLFGNDFPIIGSPANKVRSITRIFANEREDKPWFHDKGHWIDYLTMLATNRFNRFSLTLGIQYDYPYHNHIISDVYLHFPYPFLVDLPQHSVRVQELSDVERDTNLEMLKFIGREAARRGLDFQLGLWTQRYDFDDVPNANYTILGVTEENLAPYCRDAIATILAEVPEITGLTFRIHVEGGISEGDYDFWRTAFDGIKSAGRPIEIDMHAKGLDETTLEVALETGMPVAASPKYLAEHIGLAYHPSAIREREYPPTEAMTNREKLSVGSRRFLRQSYGDLLPKDKRWKVIFRVWPGTQRVLAWGDPELAAGYGRSASFCGADGIEWMEPLSMKGRQGTGIAGGRALYEDYAVATRLDWQKYIYQYRLWGRMSYDPNWSADHELGYLAQSCGDAAPLVAQALASASKILPLVTQTHGPSIANNAYWPEIYTNLALVGDNLSRPYGFDMEGPLRFGNAPTFDPQMFATARQFAEALLRGDTLRSYSPLDVADWLSDAAEKVEIASIKIKSMSDVQRPSVQRLLIDAQIVAALGRFFAAKQRGACWAELFIATQDRESRLQAVDYLYAARQAWKQAVDLSRNYYHDDLTFGPGPHLRGSWADRLPDIDREVQELSAYRSRGEQETEFPANITTAAKKRLTSRMSTRSDPNGLTAPQHFRRGEEISVVATALGEKAILHYRKVNQAERWKSTPMDQVDGKFVGTIPGGDTDSAFHMQFYLTVSGTEGLTVVPGFDRSLANCPYAIVLQG